VAAELRSLRTVVVRGGSGAALAGTALQVLTLEELSAAEPARHEPTGPGDLLAISYTSGTTGRSKGVRVPHAQAYTYASWADAGVPGEGATVLVTLPLFHLSGQWYGLLQSLIAGATCVIRPRFSPNSFWPEVREYGVTHTMLLGAMAQMLLSRPPLPSDADTSLQLAVVVPLPPGVDGFRSRFGCDVATVYGMTECGIPLTAPPGTVVEGGAGRPRPGYQVRIVDEDDREVPPDTVGELVVRPDEPWTVMDGYHGLPEATALTFRNLWLHTGDAFSRNAEGEHFFRDRIKDSLRRRGENISSFEVEATVNSHPAVAESAVVAVPSDLTEDDLKVVVVLRDGEVLDPAELVTFLSSRMPYFTVPRFVEVLDALPKTPTQKVRKAELRAAGVTGATWDRESAGVVVDRHA
jgi:crotonobetaine/carnitine-CoA ligase